MSVNKKSFSSRDIALAFEGIGGVRGLIRWAKANSRNRQAFYQMFRQEIAAAVAGSTAPEIVKQDTGFNLEQIINNITDAHRRQARDEEARTGMRMIDGVKYTRVVESNAAVADVTPHGDRRNPAQFEVGVGNDVTRYNMDSTISVPQVADTAAPVTAHAAAPDVKTTPAQVPQPIKRELTPMEARERALGPPNPPVNNELNATKLFYESSGRQRATWSAPRSWSGC